MKALVMTAHFAALLLTLTAFGICSLMPKTACRAAEAAPAQTKKEAGMKKQKILVAYFSRTGENYGVGSVKQGNTSIIADMIAQKTGADKFEIARAEAYPKGYDDCTKEARRELGANARPKLKTAAPALGGYDVIFLGYPNWWGDMPMPVYTFLESGDFAGKTVIPFCTHAGSGLSGTPSTLKSKLPRAKVLEGLAIAGTTAQNDRAAAQKQVGAWLAKLGY